MIIPKFLSKYFWDVDVGKLDVDSQSTYIIERLLEKGDDVAVRWLRNQYDRKMIADVAQKSRRLSPKSQRYWGIVYNLWSTPNQSIPPREGIWQH